ncbi:MAG TPA: chemotaxis protein CheD [Polyangiaceae bacterium]|nr:chemotaxis protein CheD [Polyangiaceae bacterium]
MQPDAQLATDIYYLEPGRLLVSTEPCTLRTVLGSCVSVCLYDPELRLGGMNHFMLPRARTADEKSLRYGDRALTALVERLAQLGAERRRLCASVFGGAAVLSGMSEVTHLGRLNAEYALDWLAEAGIGVVASDVLGSVGRRLDFHPGSGQTTVRLLGGL